MQKSKRWLQLLAVPVLGVLLLFLSVWAAGWLANPGLEAPFVPYGTYNGWNLQVANGWTRFFVPDNTYKNGTRLRFFSASDWAAFNGSPNTERVEEENAQVWWSSSTKKFDAGIYQQITGVISGEVYGFQAGILQVFETTTRSDPATGVMSRRVGIDPFGGSDPESPTVLWSPEEQHAAYNDPAIPGKKYTWFWPSVGAQAQAATMTLFIRVSSTGDGVSPNSDQVWADDSFFEIAPTTTLTLSLTGPDQLGATWSGAPRPGFTPYASEAQYKHISDTTWTDLQIFDVLDAAPPTGTGAAFAIQPGETYLVRARTWHEISVLGRTHQVAGPWTEAQYPPPQPPRGGIAGVVQNNRQRNVHGATVWVSSTLTATTAGGYVNIPTGAGTFGLTATLSGGWTSPQPVHVTVVSTETVPVTLTLRPPDDFIVNGDFEGTLAGWSHTLTAPTFITQAQRSGGNSLCITGTAALTQTGAVSKMYQPVLSFWYRLAGAGGGNTLTAEIFGPGDLTPTTPLAFNADSNGWRHAYLPLNLEGAPASGSGSFIGTGGSFWLPLAGTYSGDIGVRFAASGAQTAVCLDEVSVGSTWGGPFKLALPLILKGG
ncbi:MAG: hypothetical protein ACE5G8_03120 [Anaerolineae bacterium]